MRRECGLGFAKPRPHSLLMILLAKNTVNMRITSETRHKNKDKRIRINNKKNKK